MKEQNGKAAGSRKASMDEYVPRPAVVLNMLDLAERYWYDRAAGREHQSANDVRKVAARA